MRSGTLPAGLLGLALAVGVSAPASAGPNLGPVYFPYTRAALTPLVDPPDLADPRIEVSRAGQAVAYHAEFETVYQDRVSEQSGAIEITGRAGCEQASFELYERYAGDRPWGRSLGEGPVAVYVAASPEERSRLEERFLAQAPPPLAEPELLERTCELFLRKCRKHRPEAGWTGECSFALEGAAWEYTYACPCSDEPGFVADCQSAFLERSRVGREVWTCEALVTALADPDSESVELRVVGRDGRTWGSQTLDAPSVREPARLALLPLTIPADLVLLAIQIPIYLPMLLILGLAP